MIYFDYCTFWGSIGTHCLFFQPCVFPFKGDTLTFKLINVGLVRLYATIQYMSVGKIKINFTST